LSPLHPVWHLALAKAKGQGKGQTNFLFYFDNSNDKMADNNKTADDGK
jgi:hypothetical protein